MRTPVATDCIWRAGEDHLAARVAAFGAKVDQPVAGVDHIEIVFNNHNGVPGIEQLVEGSEQLGDVVKVQTGGRLVEHEQLAARFGRVFRFDATGQHRNRAPAVRTGALGQMPGQFEALRLTAGKRWHRLPEAHVVETNIRERLQGAQHLGAALDVSKERNRLADGQLQHVADAFVVDFDLAHFGAEAGTIAIGAPQVNVGQELHLDVLKAGTGAGRAAAVAGVETEGALRVATLNGDRSFGEDGADRVKGADKARRVGSRRLADRRLVDKHHIINVLVSE